MRRVSGRPLAALYLLLLFALSAGGCASLPSTSCEQFEELRKTTHYETLYRYSDTDSRLAAKRFAPLRQAHPTEVRWYTLRTNRAQIGVCDHLYLTKDLYLLRKGNARDPLIEQHEFYTGDGKLITTKREDLSGQLRISGFYIASLPLPIPKDAPPGAYRVVLRLLTTAADGGERTLATTSVEFRVLAAPSGRDENRSVRGRRT